MAIYLEVAKKTGVLEFVSSVERKSRKPDPERGRPTSAQFFGAGKSGKNNVSPGATTQVSRTLFKGPSVGILPRQQFVRSRYTERSTH